VNGLPEMIVASDCLAATEAKKLATVTTHHFVAAFTLGDGNSAIWT
jgi:hypothetical protein